MKSPWKRLLPIFLVLVMLLSIGWYLFSYDTDFTRDMLLKQARWFERNGKHGTAAWVYGLAYRQSGNEAKVAIELAEQYRSSGNYTKAEFTLSDAIKKQASVDLYIALCKTYVEQDKLMDAVAMLDSIPDAELKKQVDALRPAAPTAAPDPGSYNQLLSVVLTSEDTAYVGAGGYPSIETDAYTQSVPLVIGENTLYVLTIGENGLVSPLTVLGYYVENVIQEVTFADPALETAVRELLQLAPGDPVMTDALWDISELSLPKEVKDLSDLSNFTGLKKLTVSAGQAGWTEALAKAPGLETLEISGATLNGDDLGRIAALPMLTSLSLQNCGVPSLHNLSAAAGLTSLTLSDCFVSDISALGSLQNLKKLDLSNNAVKDVTPLGGLTQLETLSLKNNALTSADALQTCVSLTDLDLSNNQLESITALAALTQLRRFHAADNKLTAVTGLSAWTRLKELNLSNNEITDVAEFGTVDALEVLDVSYNKLTALPTFGADSKLITVHGAHNEIASVKGLSGLQQLNYVYLDNNKLTSVDALASCPCLIQVDVYSNAIPDVSSLTKQNIIVHYTPMVS